MAKQKTKRNKAWRKEIALALLLWRDYKCDGKLDGQIMEKVSAFAEDLDVREEFDTLHSRLPLMEIKPYSQPHD